ncbi:MAG TPA: hypothetical protein VHB73_03735 [Alphaproteobacteria bacterium]|nr:hypothetical protein [Alphaproteobacteria bacterium]
MKRLDLVTFFCKSASLALVLAAAWPHAAQAQNMQTTTAAIVDAMKDLPTIVSGAAYTFGGLMILGGANKLKMHAENPSQTPMSHGIVRIGVGGVVAGLPPFMAWVNNSLAIGNNRLGFKRLEKISSLFDFHSLVGGVG